MIKTINIVVTGASSYLGKKLIKCFLTRDDVRILAVSRSPVKIGVRCDKHQLTYLSGIDLLDQACLKILKERVQEVFSEGAFHVINCVGSYWEHFPLEESSLELCRKVIRENFETVFNTGYTLLPVMRVREGGHFIGFGCNSTRHHYPYMAPYTASKQAVATFIKSICNEYGKWGIQANCFLLSTLKTEREFTCKPFGDYEKWLDPYEVAWSVWSILDNNNGVINGSEIELMKYSEQYNWKGYFERIRKK